MISLAALAFRPFLEPLPLHGTMLWLALPAVAAVAVVIKALSTPHPGWATLRQSAILAGEILAFLAVSALLLWGLTVLA